MGQRLSLLTQMALKEYGVSEPVEFAPSRYEFERFLGPLKYKTWFQNRAQKPKLHLRAAPFVDAPLVLEYTFKDMRITSLTQNTAPPKKPKSKPKTKTKPKAKPLKAPTKPKTKVTKSTDVKKPNRPLLHLSTSTVVTSPHKVSKVGKDVSSQLDGQCGPPAPRPARKKRKIEGSAPPTLFSLMNVQVE